MESFATAPSQKPFRFFGLPSEIRLQIYQYFLPQRTIFDVTDERFYRDFGLDYEPDSLNDEVLSPLLEDKSPCNLANEDQSLPIKVLRSRAKRRRGSGVLHLLQISRQISDEALGLLYGGNVFKIFLHGEGESDLKKMISETNRRNIRHIMLVLRPMGASYQPNFAVDKPMWNRILPHLVTLRIVADQPVGDAYSYHGRPVVKQMNEWIECLTPTLEYLAKSLSSKARILVDLDGREEMHKLFQKHLSQGFQKVRTRTGDFIFRRGEFSIESRYWKHNDFGPAPIDSDYDTDYDTD
ncbi:MAG: hypothetical protein Q9227_008245 [Pyrenula ochraceoflavens]